jgi:hypothetical protein
MLKLKRRSAGTRGVWRRSCRPRPSLPRRARPFLRLDRFRQRHASREASVSSFELSGRMYCGLSRSCMPAEMLGYVTIDAGV